MRFEAQFGNIFNRTLFCDPNTNWSSPAFGTVNTQCNQPRSIQFALTDIDYLTSRPGRSFEAEPWVTHWPRQAVSAERVMAPGSRLSDERSRHPAALRSCRCPSRPLLVCGDSWSALTPSATAQPTSAVDDGPAEGGGAGAGGPAGGSRPAGADRPCRSRRREPSRYSVLGAIRVQQNRLAESVALLREGDRAGAAPHRRPADPRPGLHDPGEGRPARSGLYRRVLELDPIERDRQAGAGACGDGEGRTAGVAGRSRGPSSTCSGSRPRGCSCSPCVP